MGVSTMYLFHPAAMIRPSVRAAMVAVALVGASITGTTSASAAVMRPADTLNYSCTAGAPEVCIGVYTSGPELDYVQINMNLPNYDVGYVLYFNSGDKGVYGYTASDVGGPGWVGASNFSFYQDDPATWFCAYGGQNGGIDSVACVNAP